MPTDTLTQTDIEQALRALGLGLGDAVEVHSSLSRMGRVAGGAATVIAALQQVVGQAGAIVMSAYPVSLPIPLKEEEQARGITWKVRILPPDSDEPTGMGAVADLFCRLPGTVTGQGLHRVCAWGREAGRHSQGYQHLRSIDGWVLLIGVGIYRCSSLHLAEQVPIPPEISACWRLPPDIRRDYPSDLWDVGYGGTPGDAWGAVQAEADRRGWIRHGRVGAAECMLFRANDLVSLYEDMRRTDPFGLFGVERDPIKIIRKPDYQLSLIVGQSDPDPEDDNIDVEIKLASGLRYAATFFTLKNIYTLMERHSQTGECANGLYFWASDMILVKELTEDVICKAVEDLIASGEIDKALTRIELDATA